MSQKTGLLFAGQGAQTIGMGKSLAARYSVAAEIFRNGDEILERSLSTIAFEGPDDLLTNTANCQPALYVHGLACLAALREELGDFPIAAAAGLSLGEFTAHAAAGTFDFETGLRLVALRGQFMQEACEATEGGMAAMIGAEENVVRDLAAETDVDVANLNSPGQVVISGEAAKVALAVSLAKEHGIRRAALLNVAGAYHSRLMRSAYLKLADVLKTVTFHTPRFPVICNVDAIPVTDPEEIRKSLLEQVTGTVRWTECVEYMFDHLKVDTVIELGPGKTLAGLVQRTRKTALVTSVGDPETLDAAKPGLAAIL